MTQNCRQAVLLYPQAPPHGRELQVGGVRVRCLAFELDGDLEEKGERFLAALSL